MGLYEDRLEKFLLELHSCGMKTSLRSHIHYLSIDQFEARLGVEHACGDHAVVLLLGPAMALNSDV